MFQLFLCLPALYFLVCLGQCFTYFFASQPYIIIIIIIIISILEIYMQQVV